MGINAISITLIFVFPLVFLSWAYFYWDKKINFIIIKTPLVISFFLLPLCFFPAKWDDEFAYPAHLPIVYVENGELFISIYQSFFSGLFDSAISASTSLFYVFESTFLLRFFNLIIVFLISCFFSKLFFDLKINKKQQFIFWLTIFSIPIFSAKLLIIKNDMFGAYLILSIFYFLIYLKSYKNTYLFDKFRLIGYSCFALLTTIKPVFLISAIPILFYYIYLIYLNDKNLTKIVINLLLLFFISLFFISPWIYRSYFYTGQPFFPYINLPFFDFNFNNSGKDDLDFFMNAMKVHHSVFKDWNFLNGTLFGFFSIILKSFSYIYFFSIFSLFFVKNKTSFYFTLLMLVYLFLFCFWTGRYWIGIILVVTFILFQNFHNLKPLIKKFFYILLPINLIGASFIYFKIFLFPSFTYLFYGADTFLNVHVGMLENDKLINYLNENAKNSTILIDNLILAHLDKSISKYSWNQLNIHPFNNRKYPEFKQAIYDNKIKYIIFAHDSWSGYLKAGAIFDKGLLIKSYFENNYKNLIQLEEDGIAEYRFTFGRSSVYEIVY